MKSENRANPKGWEWVSVGSLASLVQYGTSQKASTDMDGVPVLRMGNIQGWNLDISNLKYLPEDWTEVEKFQLQVGDILFNRTNSVELVGKTAVFRGELNPCTFASYLIRVRLINYHHELFSYYLNSCFGKAWIANSVSQQVGQANINGTKLKALEIPLPPLNEQHRIVAKIEALTDRSRKARAALDAIPALLDQFRQSVLAAAFRGDLTADWRAQNPDVEPAETLLERIRAERRARWKAAELEKMKAKGKVPKNDKWKEKYPKALTTPVSKTSNCPENWLWLSLDTIVNIARPISYGILKPGEYTHEGVPMLRIIDIKENEIDISKIHRVSEELSQQYKRTLLEGTEIVISLVGTIGLVAEIPRELAGSNIHRNLGLIAPTSFVHTRFLLYWLSSPLAQSHIASVTTGANQPLLNLGDIKELPIPIPPLSEQEVIVSQIEHKFGVIQTVSSTLELSFEEIDILDQSILAKAFRGQLVSQDPNDEPASVLLERIRAEREKTHKKKGKGGKGKGKR